MTIRYPYSLLCEGSIPWLLPLERCCMQIWECSPSSVSVGRDMQPWAVTGCPAPLFCSSSAKMISAQPEHAVQCCASILLGTLIQTSIFEVAGWWRVTQSMYWALLGALLCHCVAIRGWCSFSQQDYFSLSPHSQAGQMAGSLVMPGLHKAVLSMNEIFPADL